MNSLLYTNPVSKTDSCDLPCNQKLDQALNPEMREVPYNCVVRKDERALTLEAAREHPNTKR